MAMGPGKYDEACTLIRGKTGGSVILIVLGGNQGSGFSCQADIQDLARLPELLESVAKQIREDRDQGIV